MSALAERPMDHASVRQRLGMPLMSKARMLIQRSRYEPPPPPIPPRVRIEARAGCPFNFYRRAGSLAIVALVALKHGLTPDDLLGDSHSRPIVKARHEAIMLVKTHRPWMSLPEIGRIFNRDHTTILSAVRKMTPAVGTVDQPILERLVVRRNLGLSTLSQQMHSRPDSRFKEGCATRPDAAMVEA